MFLRFEFESSWLNCLSHVFQEEELRKGGEAKYAHLAMELHVFIEVTAPIPEAYLRMAHAMDEVKKFLIPVSLQMNLLHPSDFFFNLIYQIYG